MLKKIVILFCIFGIFIGNSLSYYSLSQKIKNNIETLTNKYLIKRVYSKGYDDKKNFYKILEYIKKIDIGKNNLSKKPFFKKKDKYFAILDYTRKHLIKEIESLDFDVNENDKIVAQQLGIKFKKLFNTDVTKLQATNFNIDYSDFSNYEYEKKNNINYSIPKKVYALKLSKDEQNLLVEEILLQNKKILKEKIITIFPKNTFNLIKIYKNPPQKCYDINKIFYKTEFEGLNENYLFVGESLRKVAHNMEDWIAWKTAKNNSGNLCNSGNYWEVVEVANALDTILIDLSRN